MNFGKYFNGQYYGLGGSGLTKGEARAVARSLRRKGKYNARTTKELHPSGYTWGVWVRKRSN